MDAHKMNIMQIVAQNEQKRLDNYAKYARYYDGNHDLKVPEKYMKIVEQEYNIKANYCAVVVDALVSRLKIEGIKATADADAVSDAATEFLSDIWDSNRMDAKHIRINRGAIKCGDAFIQVWPRFVSDSKKPVGFNISYMDSAMMFPFYSSDDDDSLQYVKKQWIEFDETGAPLARKDIFYPDKIERYYAETNDVAPTLAIYSGMGWTPFTRDGFDAVLKNPYGVIPIVHVRNRQDESPFGASELENAMTLQDGINKAVIDLMRISDAQGFPQRYITGVDEDSFPKDSAGNPIVKSGPAETWLLPADATAGELSEADPAGLLLTIDKMIDRICEVTRTPRSAMSTDAAGSVASGFALQKIEGPLIDKAKECQTAFGNAYEDVCKLLLTMGAAHGMVANDGIKIEIIWQSLMSKSPSDEYQEAQTVNLLVLGKLISRAEGMRRLGYNPAQIDEIMREIEEESNKDEALMLGHSFDNTQQQTDEENDAQI